MSGPQLQTIFQELDYLDDGYNDGLVSHVGLRRIILETPELEAEVGPTFTRALLTRHSALFFKFYLLINVLEYYFLCSIWEVPYYYILWNELIICKPIRDEKKKWQL